MQQPHKLQSILIARLTGYAIRRPLKVIAVATFAAMACVWFTVDRLELRTNRTDLVNPNSKFQQDWLKYRKTFAAADDVILMVEGTAETITPVIDELDAKLNAQPALFENIHARFDRTPLLTKGLHFLQPDQLAKIDEISQLMLNVLDSAQQTTLTPSQWNLLAKTTTDDGTYQSPWPIESIYREVSDGIPEYVLNDNDSMGIVALQLVQSDQEFAQGDKPIRELRQIVSDAAEKHPLIRIGVTGLPVIEYDEMSTSQHDMSIASMVTLGLVGLLFWAGFGDLRFPAFAIASLLIGIMWTCGYLTLLVGHLNILSISFGVILIGLGIDFSIHYVARYLANPRSQEDTATTIRNTAAGVGPAILAGGVTTSLAFFATALAEFRGVAELGLIAGGGILLCVISTLLVLPAFLQLDRRNPRLTRRGTQYFWYGILRPCWSQPQHTTLWGLGITVLLAMGLVRLQYDHNLLNLQADGLDSVAWEHRLLTETDRSVWFAVSIAADRSELIARRQAFEALDSVERVEDLLALTPTLSTEDQRKIQDLGKRLESLPKNPPAVLPVSVSQVPPNLFRQFESPQVNFIRTALVTDTWKQLKRLQSMASSEPPSLADLPAGVRARFIGHERQHLQRVYARGDVWNPAELAAFVKDVESIDPSVTGQPLQNYYGSRQMQRSYLNAAVFSTLAVFLVLWWDLRKPSLVLFAAAPMLLSMIQLFGLMGWLQIPLNPANIIIIPLIIGIGIDDGIHVVHDREKSHRRLSLGAATTNGIIMTSLTSMIGFGSLMLAQHEGLRSLGRVATLGISCCLLTSVVMLPSIISVLRRLLPRESRHFGSTS